MVHWEIFEENFFGVFWINSQPCYSKFYRAKVPDTIGIFEMLLATKKFPNIIYI